jgi:hypothetical protein
MPVRRGATCVDEALNNGPYGHAYPEIVPQLSVAVPRLADCTRATQAPAWRPAMRGGSKAPRRAHPAACPTVSGWACPVMQGIPGKACRFWPRAISGEPCCESAALCAEARAHAAFSRSSAVRPDGRRSGRGTQAPRRRGRPGWVLRSTWDDEEASGSAARLCRSMCFGRESVGRDLGTCAAAAAAVELGNGFGRRHP